MDDRTVGGDVDPLLAGWRMLMEEGQKLGLVVNIRQMRTHH